MRQFSETENMNDMPLRNAPVSGIIFGADLETIQRYLRGEGQELRVFGNFGLTNFLNDSFLKGKRCVFGNSGPQGTAFTPP